MTNDPPPLSHCIRPSAPLRSAPLVKRASPTAQLLRDLVAIPSVNPAFLPPGDPRAGEARMAGFLKDLPTAAKLDSTLQEVAPGRSNLVVRWVPSGPIRRTVLLAPHLDTVGFPALDDLLQPRMSGGRLQGRGACDTKGCVAAASPRMRTCVSRQNEKCFPPVRCSTLRLIPPRNPTSPSTTTILR